MKELEGFETGRVINVDKWCTDVLRSIDCEFTLGDKVIKKVQNKGAFNQSLDRFDFDKKIVNQDRVTYGFSIDNPLDGFYRAELTFFKDTSFVRAKYFYDTGFERTDFFYYSGEMTDLDALNFNSDNK